MISHPRLASVGIASLGISVALGGCATASDAVTTTGSGGYADGDYTATGDYQAPSGAESIVVTVSLRDDVVTAVDVTGDATDPQAAEFQSLFAAGIASEVVGVPLDQISVSRVAGASLTTQGFMTALDAIKSEAVDS
ncbi:MAG: hypothetical protein CMF56_12515 [Leifsonia sp.]|nr:hypothetical protein [Leifsonia sp.]|tara:strand:- start:5804 stop:6214 length:411 start_codon:yes stop_codon:yes gene_type:complete